MAADLRYIEAWRRNPTPSKTPLHVRLDVPDGVSYAPDQLNPHNASKRLFVVPPLPEPAEMLYDFGAAIARYEERNGQWEGGDDRFTIGEEEAEDSATSEQVAAAASASSDAIGHDVQNAKDTEESKIPDDEQASKDVKEVPAAKEAEPQAAAEEVEPQPSTVKTSDSGAEDATQNEAKEPSADSDKEATKAKADADAGPTHTTPGDAPNVSREDAPDDSKEGETAEPENQAEKDGSNEAKSSEERKVDRKEKRKEKKKAKKKAQREAQAQEGTQADGEEQADEKGDEAEKGDIRKAEDQTAEEPTEEKSAEDKSQEETTREERITGDKSEEKGPEDKSEEKGPEDESEEKGPEDKSEVQEKSAENEAEGKPAERKTTKPAKDESTKESAGDEKEPVEPVAEAASTPLPADDASQSAPSSSARRAADSDAQSMRSVDTMASVSSVRTNASTRTATSLLAHKERTGLPRVVRNQLTENEFRPPPSITGEYSTHPWSAKPYKMLRATDTLAGHPVGRDPGTTWEQVSGYGVVGEDAPKDRMIPSAGNALHALFVPDPRPWRPLRLVRRSDPRQLLLMCAGTALTPGEAKAARAFYKVEQRAPTEPALASYFGSTENTDLRGGLGFVSCPTPEMYSEFTGLPKDAVDPGRLENNFSRRLERPGWLQHTNKRRAALRSVLAALEYAQWEEEGFDKLVIATHHAWIVRGITEDIWEWRSNQWRLLREGPLGIPGENVPDRDLWELLDQAVRHYEDIDCNCRFWHIPRALNGEAVRLAERGALKDNQQPSTVRWTRRHNTAQAPVPPHRIPAVGAHNAPSRR